MSASGRQADVAPVVDISNRVGGYFTVPAEIARFKIRRDLLARYVHWQQAKKQSGKHKTKGLGDVAGTTRKPYRQKGTGNARQGSLRAPQFRGGGIVHGPVVRDHGYNLPKKVRKSGLLQAVKTKYQEGKLMFLLHGRADSFRTKPIAMAFKDMGIKSALIIDRDLDDNFMRATKNLKDINVLAAVGANVSDILKHDRLVITVEGAEVLWRRFRLPFEFASVESITRGSISDVHSALPELDGSRRVSAVRSLAALRSTKVSRRRNILMAFRRSPPPGLTKEDYTAELLPILASEAPDGIEAVITLCHLKNPERYLDLSPEQELAQVRADLPGILKEEGVDVVAYVWSERTGLQVAPGLRSVRVYARVSDVLPVKLGGDFLRLDTDAALNGEAVTCMVSGRSVVDRAPVEGDSDPVSSDIGAAAMDCTVVADAPEPVAVDVYLGGRWIEHRDLNV